MTLGSGIRVFGLVVLLLAVLSWAGEAQAERRVALVVGNGAYEHAPRLANPGNDAAALAARLEALGFTVTRARDLGQEALRRSLQAFQRRAAGAEVALLFFAGHGMEVEGRNWLLPVDARLESDRDVEFEALPLDLALRAVEGARRLRLVILDACRDNPFAAAMERAGATRSIGRGLARVEPAGDTLVAYAARAGTTAADGGGANSPYTAALLRHLEEPGLEIGFLFRRVRDSVLAATGGRQEPFVYGSLSSDSYYLVPPQQAALSPPSAVPPAPAESATPPPEAAALAWRVIEALPDGEGKRRALESFLSEQGDSPYASAARALLAALAEAAPAPLQEAALPPATATPEVVAAVEIEAMEAPYRVSASSRVNLRAGPGTDHDRVGTLGPGEAVTVTGRVQGANWYRVAAAGGGEAFVFGGLLQEEAAWEAAEAERRERAQAQVSTSPGGTQVAVGSFPSPAPRPGQVFRDCPDCPEMVVIPPGSFTMGSPDSEEGRRDIEGPQRTVTIGYGLAVGKFPVTRGEYAAFVLAKGQADSASCWTRDGGPLQHRAGRGWDSPGFVQDDSHPVICVSWDDAQSFVDWLSRRTGKSYRLLSEAEWEYAARAGTTTARWWGERIDDGKASWGRNVVGISQMGTTPVDRFRGNPWGLHDMLGNVWEWVSDCWNENHARAPSDGRARTAGDCGERVRRGGSWSSNAREVRAAQRGRAPRDERAEFYGFRVARTLE